MEKTKTNKCSINPGIEKLLDSQWWIVIVSVWILVFHCLGLDMLGFSGLVALIIVMCIFCTDFRPMLTPCMMGVLVVSTQNSPGYTDGANYYFTTPVIAAMVTMGTMLIGAFIFNLTFYKRYKCLIVKSSVSLSIVVYCLALIVGGFFVASHKKENMLFIISVVASLLVVYVIAKGLVKKREGNLLFLARLCSAIAVVIAIEIGWVYVLKYDWGTPITTAWIGNIVVGFSVGNMASEIIAMMLPALFYLVYYDYKRCLLYFSAIVLCMIAIFFAFCRTSIIFGFAAFVLFTIFCMFKGKGKKAVRFFVLFGIIIAVAAVMTLYFVNNLAFTSIINMWLKDGKIDMNDNNRYNLWRKAMEYFRLNPVFGNGFVTYFFESGAVGTSWYVYLFHNTVFQLLGSAGLVGLSALVLHRVAALFVFIKKPNTCKTFFGISLLICMAMGLLDLIMFAPFVLFYYAMILGFCESSQIEGYKGGI